MRKLNKIGAPHYLKQNWKKWGKEWKLKYKDPNRNNNFEWKGHRDDLITNYLAKSTQGHCSFCDIDNIIIGASATIEHFKPKHKYFNVAYHYNNLFNCCYECQKKGKRYNKLLLKPDIQSYTFEAFFEIDIYNGKINPNSLKSQYNQDRAKETIKLYGLNKGDKPLLRLRALEFYLKHNTTINYNEIDNYSKLEDQLYFCILAF